MGWKMCIYIYDYLGDRKVNWRKGGTQGFSFIPNWITGRATCLLIFLNLVTIVILTLN